MLRSLNEIKISLTLIHVTALVHTARSSLPGDYLTASGVVCVCEIVCVYVNFLTFIIDLLPVNNAVTFLMS